ncbi:MAG: DUF4126 domain-containing protein [Gloeomargarita sp. SKYG116]|nr:DUF4126 domain-containing protein [Gloeomargarita sp. SKYG116]MCS7293622.1 DUF4126 domain-containing protein [Gloeomargarita sp. SKYB120]MDW8179188.1 DUF4126 domain-containing protein [Gloeomargarita sp. SKYBB_i_bin120]MDW8401673.1 DUF4126 domain-containing protein [Gloeomargarita sp. SKYGB_i_bin116]
MAAVLAVLAAAAAGGFRLAFPLLLILVLQREEAWEQIPVVGRWSPALTLGLLTSWAVWELIAPLHPWGVRLQQPLQVVLSPPVGWLLGVVTAQLMKMPPGFQNLMGYVGAALALLLQLVQVGWLYRRGTFPLWVVLTQDGLCALLAIFALKAPTQGGLIALMLVWLALRTAKAWQRQFQQHRRPQGPD